MQFLRCGFLVVFKLDLLNLQLIYITVTIIKNHYFLFIHLFAYKSAYNSTIKKVHGHNKTTT